MSERMCFIDGTTGLGNGAAHETRVQLRQKTLHRQRRVDDLFGSQPERNLLEPIHPDINVFVYDVVETRQRMVQLKDVFANRISNGFIYASPGRTVQISLEASEALVETTIGDDGVGIAPKLQGQDFDVFVQVHHGIECGLRGSGIGLTLAKRFVSMQGETINVSGEGPNRGGEFRVSLPSNDESHDGATQTRNSEDQEASMATRVLVVEDIPALGRVCELLLQKLGCEVRLVEKGSDAVPTCKEFHPDLILLDIGLPDVSGYEVAKQLRSELGRTRPVVAALTGYGQPEDRERALESGCDYHVTKPAELKKLRRLLTLASTQSTERQQ